MPKRGQHHNDGLNPSKPRGHEKSRGVNHPDRSQPITTQTYKKKETYAKEAFEHEFAASSTNEAETSLFERCHARYQHLAAGGRLR